MRSFEHEPLKLDDPINKDQLKALQSFYGKGKDFPYYSLINNGIKFNSYVGVLQVGNLIIEVLPKTDKDSTDENSQDKWQKILIGMLKAVGHLNLRTPSSSQLKLKANSILELYFEVFISEVEYLIRTGMLRKYRKTESNQYALKGRLIFSKQIQKNLVHQERFFTRNTIYDREHIWHIILYQTILLIKRLSREASLHNRIGALELSFPPMPDMHIDADTFARLRFNRQSERYSKAIGISKLLLLNYHPDVQTGRENVLALMFDMNVLWERFVYKSLKKKLHHADGYTLQEQKKFDFWEANESSQSIKPDIFITQSQQDGLHKWVWDTKWKLPKDNKPSSSDLQQMYAYAGTLKADKVALVYPGEGKPIDGNFVRYDKNGKKEATGAPTSCSVIKIDINDNIGAWQEDICKCFTVWA